MRKIILRNSMLGLPPVGTSGETTDVQSWAKPSFRHGSLHVRWADGTTNIVPRHWVASSALELLAMEADNQ